MSPSQPTFPIACAAVLAVLIAGAAATAAVAEPARAQVPADAQRARLERGILLWREGDFAAARLVAEELLALGPRLGRPELEAEALDLMGNILASQGRGEEAELRLGEALTHARDLGNRKLEGRILSDLGLAAFRRVEYERALARTGEALDVQEAAGDLSGQGTTLGLIGRVHFKRGEYQTAEILYRQALGLFLAAGDRLGQAMTHQDLGYLALDLHDYSEALAAFEQSRTLAEEIGDLPTRMRFEIDIGLLFVFEGEPRGAIAAYRRSLAIAEAAGSRAGQASAWDHLGAAFARRGWFEEALSYQTKALAVTLGDAREHGWREARLANTLVGLGRLREALSHLNAALAIWQEAKDRRAYATHVEDVGVLLEKLGDQEGALRSYDEAVQLQRAWKLPYASFALGLGARLHALRKEREPALALGAEAVAEAEATGNSDLRWKAYYDLGVVQQTLGLYGPARDSLEKSLAILEAQRAQAVPFDEVKASLYDDKSDVFVAAISLLLDLGESGAALEVAERARARAFLDLLAAREGRVLQGSRKASAAAVGRQTPALAPAEELITRGAELTRSEGPQREPGARQLNEEPEGLGSLLLSPEAAASVPLAELRAEARRRNATFLEYFVSRDRTFAWVVSPDGALHAAALPVGAEELGHRVAEMRGFLRADLAARSFEEEERRVAGVGALTQASNSSSPAAEATAESEVLRGLHALLVEPLEPWLPADPEAVVTVIPHGPLFLVSFAALLDREGRYLLERHTLAYSPAISVLGYTRRHELRPREAGPLQVLVVGNPEMPALPGHDRALPVLPGAEEEVAAIARLFPAAQVTRLAGAEATETRVHALAPRQNLLHFATHGIVRDDAPMASLLALAPSPELDGPDPSSDGLWTAREVFGLSLTADLVTLSACNTGLGRVSGDGVVGLARAFLYAGTPSVVVSLWRVTDLVTRFEMERFYGELAGGGWHKAAGLRRAQLATLAALRAGELRAPSGRPIPEDPAYWAPFILIGEAN